MCVALFMALLSFRGISTPSLPAQGEQRRPPFSTFTGAIRRRGGEALAQYYPPARAYPPPQTYPPQGYYPRQGYRPLPPVVDDDADDDMVYDLKTVCFHRVLPWNSRPTNRLRPTGDTSPPAPIAMGDSAVTATCRRKVRSYAAGTVLRRTRRHPTRPSQFRPNRMQFGRRRCVATPVSPGQIGPGPFDPRVIGSTQGGDPRNMAALPPDVRPETGPKKELAPQFRRTLVDYRTKEPAGTIIVDTPNTYLYLVLGDGKALRYGVGVGREGFTWSGTERVTKMAEWPDWNPPEEMIVRQPYLPRFMAGGETNPLGARALYLGKTVYRIHGTNQPSTIGTFVSSGCIRLTNEDVTDLYSAREGRHARGGAAGQAASDGRRVPLAPPAGASVLPRSEPVTIVPLGPPPFVMAR